MNGGETTGSSNGTMGDSATRIARGDGFGNSVVVESNGRVTYAYILRRRDIVGDVWLYNQVDPTPMDNWDDPERMPFLNKREFVRTDSLRCDSVEDLFIRWTSQEDRLSAVIYVGGELLAKLEEGACPGSCRNASHNGPLAKVLR